jgi:hypothetical protein
MHDWGGQFQNAIMPIGMPAMHHLSRPDDPIPEDVKDREMDFITGGDESSFWGEPPYGLG